MFKNFFNRLANQLIITFTVTIIIFIVALIFVSYNRTNEILINDFISSNKSILKLLNQNYENYVAQIDELSITFRKDSQFMEYLTTAPTSYSGRTYLQNQIKNLFYSRNDIDKLQFYIPKTNTLFTISRRNDKLRVETPQDLPAQEWYKKATKGQYFRYIEPSFNKSSYPTEDERTFFNFYRTLVSIPGWRPLGIISLSINRSVLDKMIRDTFKQPGENICIFDQDNQLFYMSDLDLRKPILASNIVNQFGREESSGDFRIKIGDRDYLAVFDRSSKDDWKMVKLIPLSLVNYKLRQIRNLSLVMGGIFLIVFMILIIIVSNTITSPVRKLTRQMEKVGSGNFTVRVEAKGSFEIVRLAERFNFMVNQINELINEKYLAELNEKTARLKALEAQINPHFLYNSLQAIATRAVLSGMKDISQMIEALAYILRYCFKEGDRVKIGAEIDQIRKYLMLQKVRFEERLSVEIEVEEDTAPIMIPKLSIQTLVENSVQHALEHMTGKMLIRIAIRNRKDSLEIKVSDNGPGMTPAELERVKAQLTEGPWSGKPGEGIGLRNLASRLRLMYGEAAGLMLKSAPGQGMEAVITLPLSARDSMVEEGTP